MMDDLSILAQHFRPEETPFIQQVNDWISQSQNEFRDILTRFLNPREQYILETMVNRVADWKVNFYGGVSGAESKRGVIAPDYFDIVEHDFEIEVVDIQYPQKFVELQHAKILGAILNSGVKRDVIGDILTDNFRWQIMVNRKMLNYIQQNVTSIGRANVSFSPTSAPITLKHESWQEEFMLLSSLRLDALIAATFNVTRSVAKELVIHQQVRMNWSTVTKPDQVVEINDIVSVRKYGRLQLKLLDGFSKRDKIKTIVNVIRR